MINTINFLRLLCIWPVMLWAESLPSLEIKPSETLPHYGLDESPKSYKIKKFEKFLSGAQDLSEEELEVLNSTASVINKIGTKTDTRSKSYQWHNDVGNSDTLKINKNEKAYMLKQSFPLIQ